MYGLVASIFFIAALVFAFQLPRHRFPEGLGWALAAIFCLGAGLAFISLAVIDLLGKLH
jgi:hypothetical protein